MKLTRHAVRRKIATSVIVCALVVLGLYGVSQLPVNFLPDITYPMVRVHIWWRGATPEEIDKSLAEPIERQMATVDGLDYLESSSIEGMYTLVANFRYGVDVNTAYQDAQAAMARVARLLPKEIDAPVIIKADPSQLPIVQLTVSSDQWDLVKLRTWTDDWLQDKILAVPGVAGTEIVGGLKREIRVNLDADALEKYGLPLATVLKRLRDENLEQFAGRVTVGPREVIARTTEEYRSLEQIRSIVLVQKGTARVTLRDVAQVEDANEEVRVITRLNGKPCIKLNVLKQADANTVEVAAAVSRKIRDLTPSLPSDIRLGMVENQADYVGAALAGVRNTALEAAGLVILTVYLFLGSWRQVLVMVLALPITLLLNFGLMRLAGFSLNIFSLGGLVVAMGVILDNSIVVLENITRLRHGVSDHANGGRRRGRHESGRPGRRRGHPVLPGALRPVPPGAGADQPAVQGIDPGGGGRGRAQPAHGDHCDPHARRAALGRGRARPWPGPLRPGVRLGHRPVWRAPRSGLAPPPAGRGRVRAGGPRGGRVPPPRGE